MNKKRTLSKPERNDHLLFCNGRTGSLLAYLAIRVRLSERDRGDRDRGERDISEMDRGERDIVERDIAETDAPCPITQQLLIEIHIHSHIRSVSGCLSFLQSRHCRARILRRH
jgi:hypothetical protein